MSRRRFNIRRGLETALASQRLALVCSRRDFDGWPPVGTITIIPSAHRALKLISSVPDEDSLMEFRETLLFSLTSSKLVKRTDLVVNLSKIQRKVSDDVGSALFSDLFKQKMSRDDVWEDFEIDRDIAVTGRSFKCTGVRKCTHADCAELLFPRNAQKCTTHGIPLARPSGCTCPRLYWLFSEDLDFQLFFYIDTSTDHSHGKPPGFRIPTKKKKSIINAGRADPTLTATQFMRKSGIAQKCPPANTSRVSNLLRAGRGPPEEISTYTLAKVNVDLKKVVLEGAAESFGQPEPFLGRTDEENLLPYYRRYTDAVDPLDMSKVNSVVTFQSRVQSCIAELSGIIVLDASHKVVKGTKNMPNKSYAENFVAIQPWNRMGITVCSCLIHRETRDVYCDCVYDFLLIMREDGCDIRALVLGNGISFLVDFHYAQMLGIAGALLKLRIAEDTHDSIQKMLSITKGDNSFHFPENARKALNLCMPDPESRNYLRARQLIREIPMYEEKESVQRAFQEIVTLAGSGIKSWVNWWTQPIILALLCRAYTLNPKFMEIEDHTNHGESLQRESEEGANSRSPVEQIRNWFSFLKMHYFKLKNLKQRNIPFRNRCDTFETRHARTARRNERWKKERRTDRQHKGADSRRTLNQGIVRLEDDPLFDEVSEDVVAVADAADDEEEVDFDADAYIPNRKEAVDTIIIEMMEQWKEKYGSTENFTPYLAFVNEVGKVALGEALLDDDTEDATYSPTVDNPYELVEVITEKEDEGEDWEDPLDSDEGESLRPIRTIVTRKLAKEKELELIESTEDCAIIPEDIRSSYADSLPTTTAPMFLSLLNQSRRLKARQREQRWKDGKRQREESPSAEVLQMQPPQKRTRFICPPKKTFSPGELVIVEMIGTGRVVSMDHEKDEVKVIIGSVFAECKTFAPKRRGDIFNLWRVRHIPNMAFDELAAGDGGADVGDEEESG